MFAVIKTGGKQYSVSADDQIRVETIAGEAGDMVEINEVLMVGNTVGTPFVEGALVTAEIVEQGRARKVIAFKKRRRQNSRRTIGHRQHFTTLQISEILTDGKKPSKKSDGSAQKRAADVRASRDARNGNGVVAADAAPAAKAEKPAAKKAEPKAEAKPAKAEKKAEKPAADNGTAKERPADAGPLFTAPAGGEKDKLTDIKGIGPVAEKQLNEQGIMTFAQIAALTADEIQTVDDYMPFSTAQITDWQEQAKAKA
ncbi:50S ribosomal protein L21 [Ahrensia sp. R2A130]|uniref:50S ribosomal protein L21 n=1 Tax=Ahrensia sp. R2A130 TaxID=744979 RepID=UPI0001E0944A|nr:50S ribosomal protein L21 [Ahrensia sp. R2A130]EFL89581.1 50S ribosomal protein L21 [Ahrensia sp. R2A130]